MPTPDFMQNLGVSALGSRLRRLFETLNAPVADLYRSELAFEQRWFTLTLLLADRGALSVQACADAFGHSQVAVIQIAKSMESAELLERRKSPEAGRVALLDLTPEGSAKAKAVRRVRAQVDAAALALLNEAAPDFLANLGNLEHALRETPFAQLLAMHHPSALMEPRDD